MGQGLSCASVNHHENGVFGLAQSGNLDALKSEFEDDSSLLHQESLYDHQSLLHIAAANGQIHVGVFVFFLCFFFFIFSFFIEICVCWIVLGFECGIFFCGVLLFQVLSWLLERTLHPDVLNRHKQVKY